jgi:Transcription elongation factor, GreA/GreB, C-term
MANATGRVPTGGAKPAPAESPSSTTGVGASSEASGLEGAGDPGRSPLANGRRVQVGDAVRVRDGCQDEWWDIVPPHEADALQRRISEATPLARALLGRHSGDVVRVDGPGGRRWPVTILAVEAAEPPE